MSVVPFDVIPPYGDPSGGMTGTLQSVSFPAGSQATARDLLSGLASELDRVVHVIDAAAAVNEAPRGRAVMNLKEAIYDMAASGELAKLPRDVAIPLLRLISAAVAEADSVTGDMTFAIGPEPAMFKREELPPTDPVGAPPVVAAPAPVAPAAPPTVSITGGPAPRVSAPNPPPPAVHISEHGPIVASAGVAPQPQPQPPPQPQAGVSPQLLNAIKPPGAPDVRAIVPPGASGVVLDPATTRPQESRLSGSRVDPQTATMGTRRAVPPGTVSIHRAPGGHQGYVRAKKLPDGRWRILGKVNLTPEQEQDLAHQLPQLHGSETSDHLTIDEAPHHGLAQPHEINAKADHL